MFSTSANQRPIEGSVDWIADTLFGQAAVTICIIAVAFVGFSMLTGRLSVRTGARVILGCFVLLAAPVIATGVMGTWQGADQPAAPPVQAYEDLGARERLEPSTYTPFVQPSPPEMDGEVN